MKFDMIVAGVGGQGILSISYVVDNAALEEGLRFKQSEVHGMAQRGGAVVSHLRISDSDIFSDLVPLGEADLLLSMEPLESLRYGKYLGPGGALVSSINPFVNIPNYPGEDEVLAKIQATADHTLVNSAELARAGGSAFAQNMVMLGAAAHLLPVKHKTIEKYISQLFSAKGEKVIEINIRAFRSGAQAGLFYRELLAGGMAAPAALAVATALQPEEAGSDGVHEWVEIGRKEGFEKVCEWMRSRKGLIKNGRSFRDGIKDLDFQSVGNEELDKTVSSEE